MKMTSRRSIAAFLPLLLCVPASSSLAQRLPVDTLRCAAAERAFAKGDVSAQSATAWQMMRSCRRDPAPVFRELMLRLRANADTSTWKWLVNNATIWRDGGLFAAALEVAGDSGATPEARAYSLVALGRLIDRGNYRPVWHPDATTPAEAVTGMGCHVVSESEAGQQPGATPLPADATLRLRALAARLADDPAAPPLLRRTAACM